MRRPYRICELRSGNRARRHRCLVILGTVRRVDRTATTRTNRTSLAASRDPRPTTGSERTTWVATSPRGSSSAPASACSSPFRSSRSRSWCGLSVGLASGYHGGRDRRGARSCGRLPGRLPRSDPRLDPDPAAGRLDVDADHRARRWHSSRRTCGSTRASVLGVKERGYVLAERALGASSWRIAVPPHPPQHHRSDRGPGGDRPAVRHRRRGRPVVPGLGVPPPTRHGGRSCSRGSHACVTRPDRCSGRRRPSRVTTVAFTLVGESFRGSERDAAETIKLERVA